VIVIDNATVIGFLNKSRLDMAPPQLADVVDAISGFLLPLATALGKGQTFDSIWHPPGPWHNA